MTDLRRRTFGEFVGTAFLVASIVGSGIAATNLTDDVGLQLLQNAVATGGVLAAMIWALAEVSGAHFNPVVTLIAAQRGELARSEVLPYVLAQALGGVAGTMVANAMFSEPVVALGTNDRLSGAAALSELVATVGLAFVVFLVAASKHPVTVAPAVGAYVAGGYYFTASTGFANPAVTLARMFTDTFTGIEPLAGLGFIGAQLAAAVVGAAGLAVLRPTSGVDNEEGGI